MFPVSQLDIVETTRFMGPSTNSSGLHLKGERHKVTAAYIKYDKPEDMHSAFGDLMECSCPHCGEGDTGLVRRVF